MLATPAPTPPTPPLTDEEMTYDVSRLSMFDPLRPAEELTPEDEDVIGYGSSRLRILARSWALSLRPIFFTYNKFGVIM